ncbi:unnamed protein product [Leuciscus chuanchicus]
MSQLALGSPGLFQVIKCCRHAGFRINYISLSGLFKGSESSGKLKREFLKRLRDDDQLNSAMVKVLSPVKTDLSVGAIDGSDFLNFECGSGHSNYIDHKDKLNNITVRTAFWILIDEVVPELSCTRSLVFSSGELEPDLLVWKGVVVFRRRKQAFLLAHWASVKAHSG